MTWPNPPNYYEQPNQGYKVILQQPTYPIIYPEPTVSQVAANMRMENWGLAAGMALFGAVAGYYKGSATHWQKPASMFGTVFFGKTGLLIGMHDTAKRLMGYRENSKEVASNLPGILAREAY